MYYCWQPRSDTTNRSLSIHRYGRGLRWEREQTVSAVVPPDAIVPSASTPGYFLVLLLLSNCSIHPEPLGADEGIRAKKPLPSLLSLFEPTASASARTDVDERRGTVAQRQHRTTRPILLGMQLITRYRLFHHRSLLFLTTVCFLGVRCGLATATAKTSSPDAD